MQIDVNGEKHDLPFDLLPTYGKPKRVFYLGKHVAVECEKATVRWDGSGLTVEFPGDVYDVRKRLTDVPFGRHGYSAVKGVVG